ncbi:N-acetyltransferase [Ideonella sp. B7]|uniref:GNAT family N-acetyltransferase n=1 Tax=Ideonella benzenivorans TaxID=2831643 RepID=UPI001CED0E93|nr:GNAT family N-acetyltransferase [Ideonella benzenivorans]MCA6217716.1 N-acetyltransferase [Ideonella benzenivorans]
MTAIELRPCVAAEHAPAILAIFNDAIAHSTALYEYQPRTLETMANWFATKQAGGYPVIGAFDAAGQLLGFASWGPFRAYPAFKYTVEHSVYVHQDHRGRGIGRQLLTELLRQAEARDEVHALIAAIDMQNPGSIALHESLGFQHAGTLPQVGFKFGRWLDLGFWQRTLPTPHQPVDG